LRELAKPMEVVAQGWRTGPTATLLVFLIEYVKLWFPWRVWRGAAHGVLGWALFPLRYFDLILLPNRAHGFGNEPYMVRRRWDYFVKNLLGAEPPKEYQIGQRAPR